MFSAMLLFTVIAAVWTIVRSEGQTPIIQINSGPIRGVEETFEGARYKAFRGIPYAAPPVADLRFKPPQPPEKWTDVRDATSYGSPCPQPQLIEKTSEDCLTLNIFIPSNIATGLKPVLVWIHGGAFIFGSGADYGPGFLVRGDIVVVTFNYRLGPLGFLATNTSDATGNWGMKDQVAALKWVQDNIAQFGGDPSQVTMYGESAGGASAHFHLFSPLSKGLFQKAIITSGSAENFWALKSPDQQVRVSKDLARLLGASDEEIANSQKRVEFLRATDSKDIAMRGFQLLMGEADFTMFRPLPFTPVIEAPGTEGAFLTEDPNEGLLTQGKFTKVPMMMGINNLEGSLAAMGFGRNFTPEVRREIEQNVCEILPQKLKEAVIAQNECATVAQVIRDVYFDGKGFDSSYLEFVDLWGDLFFLKDSYFSLRKHAQYADAKNPLYSYYFTYDGEWNMLKKVYNLQLPGAGHAEELWYVFFKMDIPQATVPDSSPEVITKNRMISFITNFVKKGDPTPSVTDLVSVKWQPADANEIPTMVIGNELKLEKEILKTRIGVWDQLNEKYTGGTK